MERLVDDPLEKQVVLGDGLTRPVEVCNKEDWLVPARTSPLSLLSRNERDTIWFCRVSMSVLWQSSCVRSWIKGSSSPVRREAISLPAPRASVVTFGFLVVLRSDR